MIGVSAFAFIGSLALGGGTTDPGQDAPSPPQSVAEAPADVDGDWSILRDDRPRSVVAFIPLTTGLTIGVRCTRGQLGAIVTGLPPAPRDAKTRVLNIAFGSESPSPWVFSVATDRTAAIADFPAPLARALRLGGSVKVGIPHGAPDGRNLRQDLMLPASPTAIDTVLSECDRPLTDPRDALLPEIEDSGLPSDFVWARRPNPTYPMGSRYAEGFAVLSCVAQPDGALKDCVVESEHPSDGYFAEAALSGSRNARVSSASQPADAMAPRLIAFRVNFILQ